MKPNSKDVKRFIKEIQFLMDNGSWSALVKMFPIGNPSNTTAKKITRDYIEASGVSDLSPCIQLLREARLAKEKSE